MKLRFYLLFVYVFISQLVFSQNLVANGDFESYSALPDDFSQTYLCNGWSNCGGATPDYYHVLGSGAAQLPNSLFGTVSPYSGSAIMGFVTCAGGGLSSINWREYISTQLSSPMITGNTYTVSFWLTNGTANQFYGNSSNHIGLKFSTSPLTQLVYEPIGGTPQLEIPNEVWTTTWQQFSFTFIADSSYNFITIGNFYDDASTSTTTHVNTLENWAYYFIDKIEIIPQDLNIISANSFCLGDSALFNFSCFNQVIDSVVWNFDDPSSGSANTSTNSSPMHIFTNPGTYNVRLIGYFGNNADTVVKPIAILNALPTIDLGNDTVFCLGTSLTLNASIPNTTYLWNDNYNYTSPILSVSQPGNYWVKATNACGTSCDTIQVSNLLPAFNFLGNDTVLCQGDTLMLDATLPNTTYLWNNGSTDSILNVSQPGSYWVNITNSCGVSSGIIEVNYTSPPPNAFFGNDTTLCQGETLMLMGSITFTTCLWNNGSTYPIFIVSQPGNYWVELTNVCGTSSDTIQVSYVLPSTIFLGNDTTLCQGEALTLDATIPYSTYLWHDNSTNPIFNVSQSGNYWVQVTNSCGSSSDTITINNNGCETILELPNVITANGDGVNGLFVPTVSKGIASMKTTIYNRWGNPVFETTKLSIDWDGQDCSDGTYFWIINYTDENGKENRLDGFVTLIR